MGTLLSSGNFTVTARPRVGISARRGTARLSWRAGLTDWLNAGRARVLTGLLFLFSGAAIAGCDPLVNAVLAVSHSSGSDRWVRLALVLERASTIQPAHLLSLAAALTLMLVAIPVLVGQAESDQLARSR